MGTLHPFPIVPRREATALGRPPVQPLPLHEVADLLAGAADACPPSEAEYADRILERIFRDEAVSDADMQALRPHLTGRTAYAVDPVTEPTPPARTDLGGPADRATLAGDCHNGIALLLVILGAWVAAWLWGWL